MKVLTALDLSAKVQTYPGSELIIVPQNDPNLEQIKAVAARLDAVKTEPKPESKEPPKN
jgi:hypothetical protein